MKRTYRWLALSMIVATILLIVAAAGSSGPDGNPNPAGAPSAPTDNPKCFLQEEKCAKYQGQGDVARCIDSRLSLMVSTRCQGLRGSMSEQRRERNRVPVWKLRLMMLGTA